MIVIPIYLVIDTDDVGLANAVAQQFNGASNSSYAGEDLILHWTEHLVEHRGQSPVLLTHDPAVEVRTYLPIPGTKIRS